MEARADATPPAPDAVSAIEAVVQAGATETHYRRAGSGPAVLLLFPGGADDPPAARLFARLARRFRVIAPRPPASVRASARFAGGDPAPVADWLRDLIDGLGLVRPGLVVCDAFGPAALAFSRTDPDRAGALVALSRGASAPGGAAMPISEMIRALDAETAAAIHGPGGETGRVCRRAGCRSFGLRMSLQAKDFCSAGLMRTISGNARLDVGSSMRGSRVREREARVPPWNPRPR